MKSASGKRPPDKAHGPGKEAIRSQQRSPLRIQKFNQISFKKIAILQFYFQDLNYFFPKSCQKFTNVDENSPEFQYFLRKRPTSLIDSSQIS